jgi:hypothetical protein
MSEGHRSGVPYPFTQTYAQHAEGLWYSVHTDFNVHGSVHRKNIPIYIQQDATLHSLLYLETALHVSGGTSTHHQERMQLYLQHLVFVRPLLLPAAIVEELEPVWVCCGWRTSVAEQSTFTLAFRHSDQSRMCTVWGLKREFTGRIHYSHAIEKVILKRKNFCLNDA